MSFFLGICIGYLAISLSESIFHRIIGHAPQRLRATYHKFGRLGIALFRAWFGHHVVHHHLTFRLNHVTQFCSDKEKLTLNSKLIARSERRIIAAEYGLIVGPRLKDYLIFIMPTLPIFGIVCWVGGAYFSCGAVIPIIMLPLMSQFIHPYLHMEYSLIDGKAPMVVKALSKSRYFRYLAVHHWLHHRYENCNYNLLLGGDFLLGVHRSPNSADMAEIGSIGLWAHSSR